MSSSAYFIALVALIQPTLAGPFPPAAGSPGSDAVPASDPRISFWASAATVTRGLVEIDFPEGALVTYGSEAAATGPADATPDEPFPVISLGDGGSIDLEFPTPFGDVPGPDFAVFENGFIPNFLELAHVEVSSDGEVFHRFPSTSLTPINANFGGDGAVDPTDIRNLAGKYLAGNGTPFDLAELRRLHPTLDTQRITHVRLIDVVGTHVPQFATRDSNGRIIADPYPTPFSSGGFDLDAVGAFRATTTSFATWAASQGWLGNDATATADPDQDGVPNLIAYLTGGGSVRMSGDVLAFPRLAYRSGGNLKLQGSPDLIEWTDLAESIGGSALQSASTVTVSETGTHLVESSVGLPPGAPWKFFRLAAELTPPP